MLVSNLQFFICYSTLPTGNETCFLSIVSNNDPEAMKKKIRVHPNINRKRDSACDDDCILFI